MVTTTILLQVRVIATYSRVRLRRFPAALRYSRFTTIRDGMAATERDEVMTILLRTAMPAHRRRRMGFA